MINTTAKKIASNTVYQIIGKALSMSITILAVILVTRFYGREGYGEFSLMQEWPALFFIIVDFGFNAIASKELSKDFSKASKYFGNLLVIRFLISSIFILSLWVALVFFPYSESLKFGIRLNLFLIITQALYSTTNIIFQTKLRYDLSSIGYVTGYILILLLILLFSFLGVKVAWVSFAYVLGGVLTFGINWYFVKKLGVVADFALDFSVWKFLFIQSLPLGLMFVFSQLNFKSDSIMMSVLNMPKAYGLNNTESVAVYNLPYKVFEVSLVVPTFFMNAAYPVFVRHSLDGSKRLKNTFFKALGFLTLAGLVCGLAGVFASPLIIRFLGGREFYQSILVLQILLAGMVIFYITSPLSWLIVTLDKQVYLPWIYLVNAIFNIVANYVFIPKYSFYAAAMITHLSELIILLFLVVAAHKAWKLKYGS